MKHAQTIILTLILCNLIGLQRLHAQERRFTFMVNDKACQVSETSLNTYFSWVFIDLKQRRATKDKDFELWRDSFERWKDIAINGRFEAHTYGYIIGSSKYHGSASSEDLGLTEDGKSAKGNPNKPTHKAQRMALLNHYLMSFIINNNTDFKVESPLAW